MKPWVERVRAGDFAAIPPNIDFRSSAELAHLIDGYELVGGHSKCAAIRGRLIEGYRQAGRFKASALDLWVGLFYSHRGYRHSGWPPTGDDLVMMDDLARALRRALLDLTSKQRAGLIAAMNEPEPRTAERPA